MSSELEQKLSEKLGKSVLEKRIKEKQEEYAGLLNRDGAIYAISKEEGLEEQKEYYIDQVWPVKQFSETGKVSSLVLSNNGERVRLVFWNDDTRKSEEFNVGDKIAVSRAREKQGKYGPELHYTNGTSVTKISSPIEAQKSKYVPETPSVELLVKRPFSRWYFDRGVVRTVICENEGTGKKLVLWNDNSFFPLSQNMVIQVDGYYEKDGDIHAGRGARITEKKDYSKRSVQRKKVKDLKDGDLMEIRAVVERVFPPTIVLFCPRHNNTKCDCEKKRDSLILSMILSDDTGDIRTVAFFDMAEDLLGITGQDLARDQNAFDNIKPNVLGVERLFYGSVRDGQNGPEFILRGAYSYDIDKELEEWQTRK